MKSAVLISALMVLLADSAVGLCNLKHNGTVAQCDYLEDIKYIRTFDLKGLKVVSVGKHLSAEAFGNLTTLQHLDLSHGKLRRIEPGSFAKLRNLRSIDLSNNHLTHLARGTFEGPNHLRVVNLRGNALAHIPSDAADLKNLKFLEISSNKLQCDCKTLKMRDELTARGIFTSKKTKCAGPGTLKDTSLDEPDTEVICMLEKQDAEMQADAPEGSGDLGSGDAFDELEPDDIPEDEKPTSAPEKASTAAAVEVPLTAAAPSTSTNDEIFFSEEDKHASTSPVTKVTEAPNSSTPESEKSPSVLIEGSGDDDLDDGSGLEMGSGMPIVPPITFDDVEEPAEESTNASASPSSTPSGGILDFFSGLFWSHEETTPSPVSTSTAEIKPEDEGFIGLSSTEAPRAVDDVIVPSIAKPAEGARKSDELSKSSEIKAVAPGATAEPDASATQQVKKGIGSYVVLGVLLGILAALIGIAAYKSEFCKKTRKRNSREPDANDAENGTELKDLRKSLLDSNSAQPKIASNGGKPETVPLVSAPPTDEVKPHDEPTAKYAGSLGECADPVKPPRKSFSPVEEARKNGTNGKLANADIAPEEPRLVNGRNDRDSLSSIGESPSSGSLSNPQYPAPSSPGAQRVKITLQENPDSVPKTPLLITRTKTGENLVKAP